MNGFIKELESFNRRVGNSPLCRLKSKLNLYAKLEFNNNMASIKDRPAIYMMKKAIESGRVDLNTTVIESTSGNFGIALASLCKKIGLKFISVIDPNIAKEKEDLLQLLSHKVIKVTEADHTGGYLLNRINRVAEIVAQTPDSFNPNQYDNPDNYLAYYHTLGEEICKSFTKLDYVFISVSSGGTITGLSIKLKEKFKGIKVIAVDIEGSLIFSDVPKKRYISSLGASKRSLQLNNALIDDVMILSQLEIIKGCYELLHEQGVLAGPSSGAAYFAVNKLLSNRYNKSDNILIICPDSGNAYLDSIYNKGWVDKIIGK